MSVLKKDEMIIWDIRSHFTKCTSIRSNILYRVKEDSIGLFVSEAFSDNLYCLDGFIEINTYVKREYNLEIGEYVINPRNNCKYLIHKFNTYPSLGVVIIYLDENLIQSILDIKISDVVSIKDYRNNVIIDILK